MQMDRDHGREMENVRIYAGTSQWIPDWETSHMNMFIWLDNMEFHEKKNVLLPTWTTSVQKKERNDWRTVKRMLTN